MEELIISLFRKTVPLRSLSLAGKRRVAQDCRIRKLDKGDALFDNGDIGNEVFILMNGAVNFFASDGKYSMSISERAVFFGEKSVIFDEPRSVSARAGSSSCEVLVIPGNNILSILESATEMVFAQTLSERVRNIEGKLSAIYKFDFQLRAALDAGTVDINRLLGDYIALEPAIHTGVNNNTQLDVDAWSYALNRLPKGINSIFSLVLSERLSDSPSQFGESLPTRMRRRTVKMVMPGKAFVLLRPGHSDCVDLVSNLCLHAVESGKMRHLLKPISRCLSLISEALRQIESSCRLPEAQKVEFKDNTDLVAADEPVGLNINAHDNVSAANTNATTTTLSSATDRRSIITTEALRQASHLLTESDIKALINLYPHDLLEQIQLMCFHHGEYVLYTDALAGEVSVDSMADKWENRLRSAAAELLGDESMVDAEDKLVVDIISSNTKSVLNCLSPYLHKHSKVIRDWGLANMTAAENVALLELKNDDDKLYATADRYFETFPHLAQERMLFDSANGIKIVQEHEFTGITVQLFHVSALRENHVEQDMSMDMKGQRSSGASSSTCSCDSLILTELLASSPAPGAYLSADGKKRQHMIINIDYAFGEQAQHVLRTLLLAFGSCVRSVNVMGKAGGLTGSRGDILFPTHFINVQHGDLPDYRSVDNCDVDVEQLHEMSHRSVHVGPIVTIPGTLLQNRRLLRFYKTIWTAVGMEMEGTYFVEALNQARFMGIVSPSVRSRFLYYISDTPLGGSGASLALNMSVAEELVPTYAISRLFLQKALIPPEDVDFCADSHCRNTSVAEVAAPLSSVNKKHPSLRSVANVFRTISRLKLSPKIEDQQQQQQQPPPPPQQQKGKQQEGLDLAVQEETE